MNRLLTFSGEQPVYLGDLDFMQDAVKDAFLQLLRGLTGQDSPNCILKKPTAEADGVICIEGEILPYRYSTYTNVPKVFSEFSGGRTFKSGDTHDCHEVRYAQNTTSMVVSNPYLSLAEILLNATRYTRSAAVYAVDALTLTVATTRLGQNMERVDLEFEVKSDADAFTSLLADEPVSVPGAYAGTYYTPVTAEISGILKIIPAKVVLTNESTTSCLATVSIPSTDMPVGSKGSLSFTVINNFA